MEEEDPSLEAQVPNGEEEDGYDSNVDGSDTSEGEEEEEGGGAITPWDKKKKEDDGDGRGNGGAAAAAAASKQLLNLCIWCGSY